MGMMKTLLDSHAKNLQKLQEINEEQQEKEAKCKYCKKPVKFIAIDIISDKIKWRCETLKGENHGPICLGSEEYKPKFAKGDTILSQWKEHATMYIIGSVDEVEGFYDLVYYKKRHNHNRIPIKSVDKKSNKCDSEMTEAIFG